jgi:hypothetical protein
LDKLVTALVGLELSVVAWMPLTRVSRLPPKGVADVLDKLVTALVGLELSVVAWMPLTRVSRLPPKGLADVLDKLPYANPEESPS